MTYINEIESRVRAAGGAWKAFFRQHEGAWQCVLMPAQRLSEADYRILCARLNASTKPITSDQDRLRTKLHAHALRADERAQR
jgi:hypothetical protein